MSLSSERNSLLCPNCRKLVSRTAAACPYCGLTRPGSSWKSGGLAALFGEGRDLVRLIILCNVVMFVYSLLIDPRFGLSASPFHLLSPSNRSLLVLGSTGTIPLFQFGAWSSLVSASYLHGSLLHILFNMLALNQLGPLILREFGSSRMFVIYTVSGVGGFIISALMGVRFTIGASAAVCGLIGAALYYGKSRGGAYGNAVYSQISGWAMGIFVFGFFVPGINNWGHGGGMAAGALVALLLGYRERKADRFSHRFAAMLCMLTTGAVLLWSLVKGGLLLIG